MRSRFATLTILALFSALVASPAHLHGGQAAPAAQHDHGAAAPDTSKAAGAGGQGDMMAAMKASEAKLDELVKKMNEAKGSAKADAIADVVNALVQDHKAMHGAMMSDPAMMNHMMSMMDMMGKK